MFRALLAALLLLVPAAAKPAPGPALWTVRDGDTTVHLFGTVHALPPGTLWIDDRVRATLDASDTLVLEMLMPDDPGAVSATMARLAGDTAGLPPLAERIAPDARPRLTAAVAASKLPAALLDRMETWFAALLLTAASTQAAGYDPDQGVERALMAHAPTKPVIGLETVEQQLGVLDTLSEADQRAFLTATLDDTAKATAMLAQLVELWRAGEVERLAALLNDEVDDSPALKKALLTDRNARWADWIAARMATPGTLFVAVGAGHLAGPDSVQAMLAARGLTATRVS